MLTRNLTPCLLLAAALLAAAPATSQVAPTAKPKQAAPATNPANTPEAKACQASLGAFRQAAIAVSKQAADPAAALKARATLAAPEAAARKACKPFPIPATQVDFAKEDLDISLGAAVPACKSALDASRPHMLAAQNVLRTRDMSAALKVAKLLGAAAADAKAPCKDYPGVVGRLHRAESDMNGVGGAS